MCRAVSETQTVQFYSLCPYSLHSTGSANVVGVFERKKEKEREERKKRRKTGKEGRKEGRKKERKEAGI